MNTDSAGTEARTRNAAVWALLVVHTATWLILFLDVTTGFGSRAPQPAIGVPAAVAVGLLHLRHALAIADGRRPRAWPFTLAGLAVLVILTEPIFDLRFSNAAFFLGGSAALLLPRRGMAFWIGLPTAYVVVADFVFDPELRQAGLATQVAAVTYVVVLITAGIVGLYVTAMLAHVLDRLDKTRAETMGIAIGTERIRLSRDLHDLLGQHLAAMVLKADVASQLYEADPDAAQRQVRELTQVAEQAMADLREVVDGLHPTNLATEVEGARRLLELAGIHVTAALVGAAPPGPASSVLAWAVREGAVNVLRHSQATRCSIGVLVDESLARFEIVNDRADLSPQHNGSGLVGLAERVRSLGGTLEAGVMGAASFRLSIEIPVLAAGTPPHEAAGTTR